MSPIRPIVSACPTCLLLVGLGDTALVPLSYRYRDSSCTTLLLVARNNRTGAVNIFQWNPSCTCQLHAPLHTHHSHAIGILVTQALLQGVECLHGHVSTDLGRRE